MQATSDLQFLFGLVGCGILAAYLVASVVHGKKLKGILATELSFYIVALPAFGMPCIVFRGDPDTQLLHDVFFIALQLANMFCISVEPAWTSFKLFNSTKKRGPRIVMMSLVAISLGLLIGGLACYIFFRSQWVWSFMEYLALLPALFTWSLVREMEHEEERQRVEHTLRHIAMWLLVPTLAATTLVVVAGIVPAAKAPVLHDSQYLTALALSLWMVIVRRVISYSHSLKRDVSEIGQAANHNGPSSDDLLPPERHGQELRSLGHETASIDTIHSTI